jgi:murein DD-endopeptidase MepM/ murein hydrolase activator NlpD
MALKLPQFKLDLDTMDDVDVDLDFGEPPEIKFSPPPSFVSRSFSPGTLPGLASASDPLVSVLQKAGFTGQGLKTAYAIAKAESGLNPRAYNPNANTGDLSYGLFQINMLGGMGPERRKRYGLKSNEALYDPLTNAKVAYQMSRGGQDWTPWSTYKSGVYKANLGSFPGSAPRPVPTGGSIGSPVPGARGTGEHGTSGLPGYSGQDYFARPGSTAVAPVGGKVVRLSGHDPKLGAVQGAGGPLGWSLYIQGDDGRMYYLTHMGSRSVGVGQRVRAGQPIGTVANYDRYGRASHIHMGVL